MTRTSPLLGLLLLACATSPTHRQGPNPSPAAADQASGTRSPVPPVARQVPSSRVAHGETLEDPYQWLREKESPEVQGYLEAENAYAEAYLAPTADLRESLFQELRGRIQETDLSVPYRKDGFFYYSRIEEGQQYPLHCRRRGSMDAPEEVLLDLNELAVGHEFLQVGMMAVSDDGNLLAYAVDTTGFRQFTLYVKDLRSGELLADRAEKVTSVAWAADDRTLFYSVEDPAKRSYRLYRHALGAPTAEDTLVYEEGDERFAVHAWRTRSRDYVILKSASHTTSEVRFLPAREPTAAFRLIAPREQDHEYDVDHRGDRFYIRTNAGGRNFRVVTAPVSRPGRRNWEELVAHREGVMIEGLSLFARHLVLSERDGGLLQLTITDLASGGSHRVPMPEASYTVYPEANPEFDTDVLRFLYTSAVTPLSILEYDVKGRATTLLKETPVLGGYDRTRYATERIHAVATDGTLVPVSLVFRKDVARDGKAPLLLRGYGAYGIPSDVMFSSHSLSLLDRGVIVATAHIRGGGDLGKPWHDQGRMKQKMNSFTDFIAVAESLIARDYTSAERLAIQGGSAGGLLMGAAVNLRPELFRLVLTYVPFVDVLNTMSDPSLPLTVGEYEEWGNPADPEYFAYIRGYCPYSNLAPKAYPTMLVRTGLNDSQVMYWEPAKYVARLRALKTDANPLLFVINMGAGHGGASGRYDKLRELALDYAFLLTELGIEPLVRARPAAHPPGEAAR